MNTIFYRVYVTAKSGCRATRLLDADGNPHPMGKCFGRRPRALRSKKEIERSILRFFTLENPSDYLVTCTWKGKDWRPGVVFFMRDGESVLFSAKTGILTPLVRSWIAESPSSFGKGDPVHLWAFAFDGPVWGYVCRGGWSCDFSEPDTMTKKEADFYMERLPEKWKGLGKNLIFVLQPAGEPKNEKKD